MDNLKRNKLRIESQDLNFGKYLYIGCLGENPGKEKSIGESGQYSCLVIS